MSRIQVGSRYLVLVATVLAFLLTVFLVAEALAVPVLVDPLPLLDGGGATAAAVGLGLLIGDALLPVPSSVVMVAHGALFGAPLGAGISLIGAVGATLAGYGTGRWAGPAVLGRVCPTRERQKASALVARWGLLAVVVSRPVPLVAETVAVVAGAERLGARRTALAATAGALPAAVLYGIAGSVASAVPAGSAAPVVLVAVLAVAALLWLFGRRFLVIDDPNGATT